jgi:hypothetical protein
MVSGRIVTKMRLFFTDIELEDIYFGSVFMGIQLKDHEN